MKVLSPITLKMNTEEFKQLNKEIRSKGIVMSRVPTETRDAFVALAEKEFCGDYGLTLKAIYEGYAMWRLFFENTNFKLDYISEKVDSITDLVGNLQKKEEKPEGTKMLGGRKV